MQGKVDERIAQLAAAEPGGLDGEAAVEAALGDVPADPTRFSDEAMGIDDDLRAMRQAGAATRRPGDGQG